MDEAAEPRVVLTRLRRKLSVEQSEDSKSPLSSAPTTPTKKRGGRLAAKPLLENIDENAPVITPKRATRTSIAKDIADPSGDKALTPSRRNSRIRSTTSITSDITQGIESPRARRAARRNSATGSDTEGAGTPLRQSRRTRKDSSSSVEYQGDTTSTNSITVTGDVIIEHTEKKPSIRTISPERSKSTDSVKDLSPLNIRKSPRLMAKVAKDTKPDIASDNKDLPLSHENKKNESSDSAHNKDSENSNNEGTVTDPKINSDVVKSHTTTIYQDTINIPDKNLTEINTRNESGHINKNTSSIEDSSKSNYDRILRTNSLTNLNKPTQLLTDNNFLSDKESVKQQNRKTLLKLVDCTDSCHGNEQNQESVDSEVKHNTSMEADDGKDNTDLILTLSKNEKRTSVNYLNTERDDENKNSNSSFTSTSNLSLSQEKIKSSNEQSNNNSFNGKIQSVVLTIDDSYPKNSEEILQEAYKSSDIGDQCVPVVNETVKSIFANSSKNITSNIGNVSCEPMDIDESITDNISFMNCANDNKSKSDCFNSGHDTNSNIIQKERKSSQQSNKSSTSQHDDTTEIISAVTKAEYSFAETITQKERKSSISYSGLEEHFEKSNKEHDITPILLRVNVSNNNGNTGTISPKNNSSYRNVCEEKQIKDRAPTTDDLSANSPLKHKNVQKVGIQTSTPNIEKKKLTGITESRKDNVTKEISQESFQGKSLEQSNSNEHKSLLDNEPKDAGDDYESGDSQDEEENLTGLTETRKDNVTKEISQDSFQEESSEQSNSNEHKSLLDNEAEDAGDDYESGDSQDEEDRKYHEENEILERGETLTSEDEDASGNSDYEKDSFIVSSDDQDNELLSGSGDDLESSDNELSMSSKSKKKYNKRKMKEQKQASREMFESRHKLKENSDKDDSDLKMTKVKKTNRQRINSTDSSNEDDDEDITAKNKNRQRIDSTIDSTIADDILHKPKKRNRQRLNSSLDVSENSVMREYEDILNLSVGNNVTVGECEMTMICDRSALKEKDPLGSSLLIKKEPKTPKEDNESIIWNAPKNLEEFHVNDNLSVLNNNEKADHLQNDVVCYEINSDNDEIIGNYESVLNNLLYMRNLSLNLEKKSKRTENRQAIVDELNLTQPKAHLKQRNSKLNKTPLTNQLKTEGSKASKNIQNVESDTSSISINSACNKNKKDVNIEKNANSEDFIPFKMVESKTNISTEKSFMANNEKECESFEYQTAKKFTPKQTDISFTDDVDRSLEKKSKKNKKKTAESNLPSAVKSPDKSFANDINRSLEKENKKKEKKTAESNLTSAVKCTDKSFADEIDGSLEKESKKKKKKTAESNLPSAVKSPDKLNRDVIGESFEKTKKKKKKKHNKSENQNVDDFTPEVCDAEIGTTNVQMEDGTATENKRRKRKLSSSITTDAMQDDEISQDIDLIQEVNKITEESQRMRNKKRKKDTLETFSTSDPKEKKKSKKRKRGSMEEGTSQTKAFKEISKVTTQVRRLPSSVIDQLEDNVTQKKMISNKTKEQSKVISTTNFSVVDAIKIKRKPSQYLEESIHIDSEEPPMKKHKKQVKNPKLLPFLPTASTSSYGFTTNFQVNIIPKETKFVAKLSGVENFKNDTLFGKRIKRVGTYELYKRQRSIKLTKF